MFGHPLRFERGVEERLGELRGARVYFEELGGNNGDRLIALGSRHVLGRCGVELTETAAEADVVVVNGGGGAAVELWSPALKTLWRVGHTAPDKPLVFLPSSFFATRSDLAACFAERRAPVWLFAREAPSLAFLRRLSFAGETHAGIDHDMAFALRGSEFLAEVRRRASATHVLLVERFDHECSTGRRDTVRRLYHLKKVIPQRLRAAAKRVVAGYFSRRSDFSAQALARLRAVFPGSAEGPVVRGDVSFRGSYTFTRFVDLIAGAAAVATTRLHVGVLAAMLDKPTLLKADTGPYQKIRGVYEHSLSELPHVRLW